jgi:hypothetical protein
MYEFETETEHKCSVSGFDIPAGQPRLNRF